MNACPLELRHVLISGCGIAGPTLAYFLAEAGFRPTIVERAEGVRSSGGPVDVKGEAVQIAVSTSPPSPRVIQYSREFRWE
jgi:2-polyprenyl-6-methoxyphenol hydroxylase-like FAD-dependent oxidoreductase